MHHVFPLIFNFRASNDNAVKKNTIYSSNWYVMYVYAEIFDVRKRNISTVAASRNAGAPQERNGHPGRHGARSARSASPNPPPIPNRIKKKCVFSGFLTVYI